MKKFTAHCIDCGMIYGGSDWIDTTLSTYQWSVVCPENGILCANCIIKRASKINGILAARMHLEFAINEAAKEAHDES